MKVKVTEAPFTSKSEALQYCRNLNLNVQKVGEVQHKISSNEHPEKGEFYLNDCCQDLPNHQRQLILFLIFCLGAPITVGVVIFIVLPALKSLGIL